MEKSINRTPAKPHDGAALFVRASGPDALSLGWARVAANQGAAGGDRVTCAAFSVDVERRLTHLSSSLRDGSYRPGPLRRVEIPKKSGGKRVLSIPCIADRVAQSAVAQTLSPLLEQEFEDSSFAYRPGRSVAQALERVRRLRAEGFVWALDADIDSFFDRIPHDRLIGRVLQSISDGPLIDLVGLWLETGSQHGRGLAQGSPLSPLLANLYLDSLDEAFAGKGLRIVRYADDFVVLAKSQSGAAEALERVRAHLADAGLTLHPGKTAVRSFDEALKFLGSVFVRSMVLADQGADPPSEIEQLLADISRRDRDADEQLAQQSRDAAAERAAGYDRGVRTLYMATQGLTLGLKNLAFAVTESQAAPAEDGEAPGRKKPRLLTAIHPSMVDRIEIGPHGTATTEAMRNALSFGVELAFVNGHGETQGTLTGPLPPRAGRHLAQARHCLDPDLRLALARTFLRARLHNQRAQLRRSNQRRGLTEVSHAALGINRQLRLLERADSIPTLMGVEGAATQRYWRRFSLLLMHGWSLPARKRRPATDAVNIALNVTASILERDVRTVVCARGLHPGFGVLHAVDDGRDALVFDVMEIFRSPLAESVVLELFNTRALRTEHFERFQDADRLTSRGYEAIVRGYEERAEGLVKSPKSGQRNTWRRLMLEQAGDLARFVEGGPMFEPMLMDY